MDSCRVDHQPGTHAPVDVGHILATRNPPLHRKLTPYGVTLLRRVVHERAINANVRRSANLSPGGFADAMLEYLGITVRVEGREHLRQAHRPVVCGNHPSGAVEGLALISALWHELGACRVPANDLLCLLTPLKPIIVPVRHGQLSRLSAAELAAAFAGDDPLLVFPAGVTAREYGGRLREAPWRTSFMTRARNARRELLPVAVSGRNSRVFYSVHKLRRVFGIRLNIEMALLVHEMFRRRGDTVTVRFLSPRSAGEGTSAASGTSPGRDGDRQLATTLQATVERIAAKLDNEGGNHGSTGKPRSVRRH